MAVIAGLMSLCIETLATVYVYADLGINVSPILLLSVVHQL